MEKAIALALASLAIALFAGAASLSDAAKKNISNFKNNVTEQSEAL